MVPPPYATKHYVKNPVYLYMPFTAAIIDGYRTTFRSYGSRRSAMRRTSILLKEINRR